MSFQPVVPFGGYAGWAFLQRSMEGQKESHDQSPSLQRELQYFVANIENVTTAEELVADRQLLKVALGAFGLDEDLPNRYFIQKILEEGTSDSGALANKLSDTRYRALARAFDFSTPDVPPAREPGFTDSISEAYKTRSFETAIGQQNDTMRLALNLTRDLGDLATESSRESTKWFRVLGSEPLRAVFETAFGLPGSFATLNIDKQVEILQDRTQSSIGQPSISQFQNAEAMDELIRLFLVRSDLQQNAVASTPASVALALLQSA